MSKVHEIKFFLKEDELFIALYDKPSIFLPEFWIDNIKAKELGFESLPDNAKLERKYKVEKFRIEPFEYNKEGLVFGIAELFNRVTRELTKEKQPHITHNNQVINLSDQRNININQGNYNESIKGDYVNLEGDKIAKEEILNDFRQAWQEAENGETIPVDQLWAD